MADYLVQMEKAKGGDGNTIMILKPRKMVEKEQLDLTYQQTIKSKKKGKKDIVKYVSPLLKLENYDNVQIIKLEELEDPFIWNDYLNIINQTDPEGLIFHTRLISTGKKGYDNLHPAVSDNWFLFQNGTESYHELTENRFQEDWDTKLTLKLIEKEKNPEELLAHSTNSRWFLINRETLDNFVIQGSEILMEEFKWNDVTIIASETPKFLKNLNSTSIGKGSIMKNGSWRVKKKKKKRTFTTNWWQTTEGWKNNHVVSRTSDEDLETLSQPIDDLGHEVFWNEQAASWDEWYEQLFQGIRMIEPDEPDPFNGVV